MHTLRSIPDVCDIEIVSAPTARSATRPTVLIEVPHGATRRRHLEATRRRLVGDFPDYLEQFFFVNTDVGSIECARWIARMITNPQAFPELSAFEDATDRYGPGVGHVLIVRGLVARTFIDLNRVIQRAAVAQGSAKGARDPQHHRMTPGIPTYVTEPEDLGTLRGMHRDYQALAARAYEIVFDAAASADASALIVHTYAPRTVEIDRLDGSTLAALRRAYEPEVFETLVQRPDVDLLTEGADGSQLAPEALPGLIRKHYARIGIEACENATYRLHDSTWGYVHSVKYPRRVLCLEINRELLAEAFTPFKEMAISEANARRLAAPIAAALLGEVRG